ncbi:carbohydrate binding domain-containing protein [Paenibacillus hodogayensis]|uniref:Carbohydrate binding domain-containing protein n=1 Tax=Paenibacillus hodogayensis TaxID=279208 RepID=A0ABV5VSM5_9BACL
MYGSNSNSNLMRKTGPVGVKAALLACLLSLLLPLLVPTAIPRAFAAEIGDDLIHNGGFEQSEDSIPLSWIPFQSWSNPELALTPDAARTGTNGFRIQTQQQTKPWIAQDIVVEEGVTYELSGWLKGFDMEGAGAGFKLEFYKNGQRTSANHILGYDSTYRLLPPDITGDWQNLKLTFTAPPEATILCLFVRQYGTGTVYFDDISIVLKKQRAMIELTTDESFYYAELTEGRVGASFFSKDGHLENKSAEARIYRETSGVTIATYGPVAADQPLDFLFDPTLMLKNEPYRVEVRLLDAIGTELEKAGETVYRIDRPTMLREDGTIMVDGEPFFPIAAYHVRRTDYPYVGLAGVNTVQGGVTDKVSVMRGTLDAAQQNGLKVLVPLYANMNVKENVYLTQDFVTNLKDHPAVLAWMIMDEPIQNNKTKQELADAYRLIRSLDSKHPTYMVEAPAAAYETVSKLTDLFATDVYPFPYSPISAVGESAIQAKQAAGNRKPVLNVLQAMYNPPVWPHLPTIGELRNMAYQSLLNGAQGMAYYSFNENGFELRQSALWPGLVEFREEAELIGALITGAERIGHGQGQDTYWTLWRDGDELYASSVNTSGQARQVTVPLGITGYRSELLYGDSHTTRDEQGDELVIGLGPLQSLTYRVTPFLTLITQASDTADGAAGLSSDAYWSTRISQLEAKSNDMAASLQSSVPDMASVSGDAVDALGLVGELTDWAAQLADGSTKQQIVAALKQIGQALSPIAGAYVKAKLDLAGGRIVGQEQPNGLTVSLDNGASVDLLNVQVTVNYPEPFGAQPGVWTKPLLGSGSASSETFDFRIGSPVPQGRYSLKASIEFEYADKPGIPISVEHWITYDYMDLLVAESLTPVIEANKGGEYPFTVSLSSNVSRDLQVMLETESPPGFAMQLPAGLTLSSGQQTAVTGTVYLPAGVTDGIYEAAIRVKADGKLVRSLPLPIVVNHNLLANGGFEKATALGTAPEGWVMRQGVWTRDASHTGDYSVSLLPDPSNIWNIIASGIIPVQAGNKYALRGWVKNGSATGEVAIGLRQSNNNSSTTISYTWKPVQTSSNWTLYELEIMPAPNAQYVQVFLKMDQQTNGAAWFDDLYVEEIPYEPEYAFDAEAVPAAVVAREGGQFPFSLNVTSNVPRSLQVTLDADAPAGMTVQLPSQISLPAYQLTTVTGTVYVPSSVTGSVYQATIHLTAEGQVVRSVPFAVRIDSNLLKNPGFEQPNAQATGPANWLMRAGLWTQSEKRSGSYSASIAPDPGNAWNIIVSDLIPTEPGSQYIVRGWVKNGSTTGSVSLGLRQVKEDLVSTVKYTWHATRNNTDWTPYQFEVTPSSTAKYVQLFLWSDAAANGTSSFDDLVVERIPLP